MSKVQLYSTKSKTVGSFDLPNEFVGKENLPLVAQAVHISRHRGHIGTALTKDRGDVARTTKKWFRQKGTGHARHGARSAPIFVGGGVAHGPDGLRRHIGLPQKMRKEALKSALAMKLKEAQLVVAEGLSIITKTKDAQAFISQISQETKLSRFTLVLSEPNKEIEKLFRNLPSVNVVAFKGLNAYTVIFGGVLVIDSEAFPKPTKEVKKPIKKVAQKETKTK